MNHQIENYPQYTRLFPHALAQKQQQTVKNSTLYCESHSQITQKTLKQQTHIDLE